MFTLSRLKIVIAGGTGFIGTYLANLWAQQHEVIVLTRNKQVADNNTYKHLQLSPLVQQVIWNGTSGGNWESVIDGAHLVINLAGKSVNCRYTAANRKAILESRVRSTEAIGAAIAKAIHPPTLWINSSSATIYRHATDKPQTEANGDIHNDFSVQVCKAWEAAFFKIRTPFTRKVALRTAITLGHGGVLVPFQRLVQMGLGGKQGNGNQMFSWIHIADIANIIAFLYDRTDLAGVFNVSAPNPVTNKVFMHTLQQLMGVPFGLTANEWLLRLGAFIIGTEVELLLKSRWVIPEKLLDAGYNFMYPRIDMALQHILNSKSK
jgi:uncharacterized protein (TIGR01777 family)